MKYPPSTRTSTKYEILPNGVGTLNLERFHGHSNAQFMCIRRNLERPRCELMEAGETTRNPYSYRIICTITPSVNITTASRHDEILYSWIHSKADFSRPTRKSVPAVFYRMKYSILRRYKQEIERETMKIEAYPCRLQSISIYLVNF